ncbi:MAG: ABC transporter ATP-binding protein [Anaerolineales bacterium]
MPSLELQQVEMGYPDLTVLREVTLDVVPGEVLAVIGPNGVGKSTLVRVASGTLLPLSGRVGINGTRLVELRPAERARLVSVVPQAANLPPNFLAHEVVLMGRTPYLGWFETENESDHQVVREAMLRTETLELAKRPIGELSGGEQQRLLIARALAQVAPIMLLDEPTAHLDLRHQDRVLGLVRELARDEGLAVLLALHDLNLVSKFADRVVLLSESIVRKMGSPEEVLNPELLADVYGIRIEVVPSPVDGKPLVLSAE